MLFKLDLALDSGSAVVSRQLFPSTIHCSYFRFIASSDCQTDKRKSKNRRKMEIAMKYLPTESFSIQYLSTRAPC